MDQPGFSLFQGAESIHVEGLTNGAAEEEQEEAIDRQRREEELGKQLQNAFDDLLEEDETLDDSYQSGRSFQTRANYQPNGLNGHRETNGVGQALKRNYVSNETDEETAEEQLSSRDDMIYQLRMQLQSKGNELDHVSQLLHQERLTATKTIGDLKNQLALAMAERERAVMTKNQTHELLVESKTKVSDLDDAVRKLTERNRSLEEEKRELVLELDNGRIMLNDAQMKCHMMEKEIGRTGTNQRQDAAYKQMNERNAAQVEMMQQQIDNFRNKLEAREVELRTMEEKYRELEKARQVLLIEKTETINDLTEQMERAQRQSQELLASQARERQSPRVNAENAALRKKINDLEEHIDSLQNTTDGLLKQLDRRQDDFANVLESTPHLRKKPFLARAMNGLEERDLLVQEIEQLKREVEDKAAEIKNLIITENSLREELRRVEEERLRSAEKVTRGDCGNCKSTRGQLEDVQRYNQELTGRIGELQSQNEKLAEMQEKDNRLVLDKLKELKILQDLIRDLRNRIEQLEREKEELQNEQPRWSATTSDMSTIGCQTGRSLDGKQSIIDEYAKLTAAEVKRVENVFKKEALNTQQELRQSRRELEELQKTYKEETNLFKEVIMAEREEYERLLDEKEAEVEALSKQVVELEQKGQRTQKENKLLDSLETELQKKQEEMDEERKSMTLWRNQWKEERKQLLAIEEHLKKEMEVLRQNWKSARATASNYKLYAEEKDRFVNKEVERIRLEYEAVIDKLRHKNKRLEQGQKPR